MSHVLLAIVLIASPLVSSRALGEGSTPAPTDVEPFTPDAAIEAFARSATAEAGDDASRAHALYDALLALKRSGAIAGDRDNTPKARPPKTAAQLMRIAQAVTADDRKAGCYELSALYVAAGRSIGLDVVGVERDEAAGTGQIGHVMAGVRFEPNGRLTVFDLQNESRGTRSRIRELGDPEMLAHHYNHLAVAAFLNAQLDAALDAIDVAVRLAPDAPSFLNNRATVLAAQGEPILALAEAVHAVQRAPGVPLYRYQLGRLYLLTGEVQRAITSFEHALSLRPRYGLARRDLGWAHLLAGDAAAAESSLRRALRDEPQTPDGALYLGLFLLARGDEEAAARVAHDGTPRDADLEALERLARGQPDPSAQAQRLRRVLESVATARGQGQPPLP